MTGKKYSIVSQMVNWRLFTHGTRCWLGGGIPYILWLTLFLYIEGIVSILFATLIFKPPGPCSTKLSSSLRKSTFNATFHTISLFFGIIFWKDGFRSSHVFWGGFHFCVGWWFSSHEFAVFPHNIFDSFHCWFPPLGTRLFMSAWRRAAKRKLAATIGSTFFFRRRSFETWWLVNLPHLSYPT